MDIFPSERAVRRPHEATFKYKPTLRGLGSLFPIRVSLPRNTPCSSCGPNPRPLPALQSSSTMARAHSEKPCTRKYGTFGENTGSTNYVDHDKKMRLLKTHSHTSTLRGYEAPEGTSKGGKETEPTRKGLEKCQTPKANATSPVKTRGRGGRKCVPENRKQVTITSPCLLYTSPSPRD